MSLRLPSSRPPAVEAGQSEAEILEKKITKMTFCNSLKIKTFGITSLIVLGFAQCIEDTAKR